MFINNRPTDIQKALETARKINGLGKYADFPLATNYFSIRDANLSGVKKVTTGYPLYLEQSDHYVEKMIFELQDQPSPFRAYRATGFLSMASLAVGAVTWFKRENAVEQVRHPELFLPQATKKAEELCRQKEQSDVSAPVNEAKKSDQVSENSGAKLVQGHKTCVIEQTPNMVSSLVYDQEAGISALELTSVFAAAIAILSIKSMFNIHRKREEQPAAAAIIEGNLNLKKERDARGITPAPS